MSMPKISVFSVVLLFFYIFFLERIIMLKRFLLLLLALLLAVPSALASSLETPAPAPVHVAPEPTEIPPLIVDATKDTSAASSLRFKTDATFLHIWIPNIRNADAAILCFGDQVYMIDTGDKRAGMKTAELLNQLGITKVDKLFISHPHHDHLEGLEYTAKAAKIQEILFCFPHDVNERIIDAITYANKNDIFVSDYKDGDVFTMGDNEVTLKFWFLDDPDLDMNNNSAVTQVQFGSRRMLFTADMEKEGQAVLVQCVPAEELRTDILKYPHHGRNALTAEFLEAVNPAAAVITNVNVDWFGVKYLKHNKIPYYFSCFKRTVLHLWTDGNIWVIEQPPISKVTPMK